MKARVAFRDAAIRDVHGVVTYLAEESAGVAERFVDALQSATRRLAEHPEIGHALPTRIRPLAGLRTWPVPGFPDILVVMIASRRRVSVLRVLHGARDLPGLLESEEE